MRCCLKEINYVNVEYRYKSQDEENFKIGPINLKLKKGEITFIIGGNGSGKSTLGKIITGLYAPDNGEIFIDSNNARNYRIGELFSSIYFDTYLYKKLYGIDSEMIENKADEILRKLGLDNKINIEDGSLSSLLLSTGQKKRVALAVRYLENSDFYFFDEWAAEQDPEFKKFFYTELLPDLRNQGKCVVAITHDDRYFYIADNIVKIEDGKVMS